jgi:hypothetical protein
VEETEVPGEDHRSASDFFRYVKHYIYVRLKKSELISFLRKGKQFLVIYARY